MNDYKTDKLFDKIANMDAFIIEAKTIRLILKL